MLPFQDQLRAWKRALVGYEPDTPHQAGTLGDGCRQVAWLREHGATLDSAAVLEIGSGWEPIIPLVYVLAGARIVYLSDTTRLISLESLDATLSFLRASRERVCTLLQIREGEFDRILARGQSGAVLEDRLNALHLRYLAPCDCRNLSLDSGSMDVICSRAVLEHVPEDTIRGILRESQRLLKRDGLMCHFIDNSDHWEHRDKSISRVNFLRYGERVMNFTSVNPQNYQNRLRHQDYLNLLDEAGFCIVRAEREIDQKSVSLLPTMKLNARFQKRSHADLATVSSYVLAATSR